MKRGDGIEDGAVGVAVGSEHSPVGGVFETLEREEADAEETVTQRASRPAESALPLPDALPNKHEAAAEKNDEKNEA